MELAIGRVDDLGQGVVGEGLLDLDRPVAVDEAVHVGRHGVSWVAPLALTCADCQPYRLSCRHHYLIN